MVRDVSDCVAMLWLAADTRLAAEGVDMFELSRSSMISFCDDRWITNVFNLPISWQIKLDEFTSGRLDLVVRASSSMLLDDQPDRRDREAVNKYV